MINKISVLHEFDFPLAEAVKMKNLYCAYGDGIQLFCQAETGAVISLLDGGVIICGKINAAEVKSFLSFIKPVSVFSSADDLVELYGKSGFCELNVIILKKPARIPSAGYINDIKSQEIFDILSSGGFELPPYEYFATDYCRRKNMGLLKVFAKKDTCAAITLEDEKYRLLEGIVSNKKGAGGALLTAATSGLKPVLAVCRDELLPFYYKFGFEPLYKAGVWRK